MGLFDKIKEPVFIKEGSSLQQDLASLEALLQAGCPGGEQRISQEIRLLKAGIAGENNIAFELRNSHMPLLILQDLYLVHEDLSAQIDYLIITKKRHFIVECKNLVGDITIDAQGNFIRTVSGVKEGIYSPITQNHRHLQLLREVRRASKDNLITRFMFDKYFEDAYRSIVVLANPKTVIHMKYAPKEIKQLVIRSDQLIEYIKKVNAEPGMEPNGDKAMEDLAQFFLERHKERSVDITAKYRSQDPLCPRCGAPMALRTAKTGAHAGKQFWGCSRFPECRGTLPSVQG